MESLYLNPFAVYAAGVLTIPVCIILYAGIAYLVDKFFDCSGDQI